MKHKLPVKSNMLITESISGFLVWVLAWVLSFKVPGDPDMGWHLANGQYTISHLAVQRGDVYSWTMPNYPWVSHEWLSEVLMVAINSLGGLVGLSAVFAGLVVLVFWVATRAGDHSHSTFSNLNLCLSAIIGITMCYPIIGVRPQMMTLLGLAIVLYILFWWREQKKFKQLLWLPVVFIAWANLHAGFAAGFLVIGIFGVAEFVRWLFIPLKYHRVEQVISWRNLLQLIGISGLCLIATLINPYGWRLYEEILSTVTKTEILSRISEWLPINFANIGSYNLILAGLLILWLIQSNRWKVDYTKLTLAVVFWFVAATSWRHLALFAVVSMPLLVEQMSLLLTNIWQHWQKTKIMIIALAGAVMIAGWWHIYLNLPTIFNPAIYAERNNYPYGATQYLLKHKITGRLFNEYNWGGYLIWQNPSQQVFIDGRMAIWETSTVQIFKEFQNINGNNRQVVLDLLERWKIDLIMVQPNRAISTILSQNRDTWTLLYQDSSAVLWQRSSQYQIEQIET